MIPVNPGNLLTFHRNRRYQRHRQIGQDAIPFGLLAPRTRLLPFQVYINDALDVVGGFQLFSATNDATYIDLDPDRLSVIEKADFSGFWVTWTAEETVMGTEAPVYDAVPDCGFWYIVLTINGTPYYSEVLYLTDICGEDDARLEIVPDSCSVDGSDLIFTLQGSVFSKAGYDYSLQKYTLGWSEISDQETYEITLVEGNEEAQLRIQVTTVCGLTITRAYTATWTSGDACNTLILTLDSETAVEGLDVGNNPTWIVRGTNSFDKDNVLYAADATYVQKLYLPIQPVWDTPVIEREEQTEVNGNGEETRRFTRTVHRMRFEVPDIPDYALPFLSKLGDLDSVELYEVELDETITMQNTGFESRRQGSALNIGIFTFEADAEAFSGCQENFAVD